MEKYFKVPFFLPFSLSLHLRSVFSDVVHRAAGPIMSYHSFHVFVSIHLRSTIVQAKLLRSKFWLRARLK